MTGLLAASAIPAPSIEYGQLAPLLIVFGAAIAGVLVEAFSPREVRRAVQLVLALGSLAAGGLLVVDNRLVNFLAPVVGSPPTSHGIFTPVSGGALALVVAGAAIAWAMYGRREVPVTAPAGSPLTVAARKELYGNAINESLLMRPGQWLTRLSVYFDNRGVDGLVNTLAAALGGTSGRVRRIENGFVRSYALLMFLGAALLVGALLLVRI